MHPVSGFIVCGWMDRFENVLFKSIADIIVIKHT